MQHLRWIKQSIYRADSRFAPSQWQTSLQSNAVCHWLGSNLESALIGSIPAFHIVVENAAYITPSHYIILFKVHHLKPKGSRLWYIDHPLDISLHYKSDPERHKGLHIVWLIEHLWTFCCFIFGLWTIFCLEIPRIYSNATNVKRGLCWKAGISVRCNR